MLSKRLHPVWVLSCVGWQQCMPALRLLPAESSRTTESSSIPFLLPCQQQCKEFELHSLLWKLLRDTGYWQHLRHLQHKAKVSAEDDSSEIFLPRIIPSSNCYMEIHDGTFLLIQTQRGSHTWATIWLFSTISLYYITSCRHFTNHTSIICYNGTS